MERVGMGEPQAVRESPTCSNRWLDTVAYAILDESGGRPDQLPRLYARDRAMIT